MAGSASAVVETRVGSARTAVAYLATIAGLTCAVVIAWDPLQTGSLISAIQVLGRAGLAVGAALGVLLFPAAVLGLHLAARVGGRSTLVRIILAALSWVGWYLAMGVAVAAAGTFGLWPDGYVGLLSLIAIAGVAFSLATGHNQKSPGRAATIGALVVGLALIAACFLTAGWWGGPVVGSEGLR